jgi:uncharacterized protein YcbX
MARNPIVSPAWPTDRWQRAAIAEAAIEPVRPAHRERCNVTRRPKIRYLTRAEAEQARRKFREKGGDPAVTFYRCHACHDWHLGHPPGGQP